MTRIPLRRGMSTALLALVAAVLAPASPAVAQATPDAFYLALLRDGKAEMLRGDAVAAKKSFRLASFGFLEHPVLLAEGLARLGLAEAALNDQEAFVATFSRLAEVEERFGAYASAALSTDERRAFEEKALEWVTPDVLRSLPGFAPLLARKSEVDLARLTPRDRTRELEKRSAAEPANPRWKLLLAAEDASGERWTRVLTRLEGVADSAAGDSPGVTAACLRGQALARLKRCDEAVVALAACGAATADAGLAEVRISCLATLVRGDEARAFAAQLARPAADAPAVRKAVARIPAPAPAPATAKEEKAPARTPAAETPQRPAKAAETPAQADRKPAAGSGKPKPATAAAPPATPAEKPPAEPPAAAPSAPAPTSAPKAVPDRLTADEERLVAQARGMLKSVDNREELRRGFATFRPLADRRPERADLQLLAGEIAYRAGLWTTGAEYFRRSTPGGKGPTDPTLRFYYAVCLYEAGEFGAAAQVAATGLEKLQRMPFVDTYLNKIRAARP